MNKFIKVALVGAVLATLTACTGHIENRDKNCSYDYLLHPAISISKIIGGCGLLHSKSLTKSANTGLIARRPLDFRGRICSMSFLPPPVKIFSL